MQLLLTSCIHLNQHSQSKNHWQSPHSLSHIFMVSNNLIPLWLLQLPCSLITCTGTLDLHSLHPLLTFQDSFCESVLSQSSGNCSLPSRPCLVLSWHHHEITSIHMMCYPIFLLFLKYLFTTSNKFIKKIVDDVKNYFNKLPPKNLWQALFIYLTHFFIYLKDSCFCAPSHLLLSFNC